MRTLRPYIGLARSQLTCSALGQPNATTAFELRGEAI